MFYENQTEWFFIEDKKMPLIYPLHIHQYIELVHVLNGKVEMQIGQDRHLILPGELAVIFPNVAHDYNTLSSVSDTRMFIINCFPDLLPIHQNMLLGKVPQTPHLSAFQIHADIPYAENRLLELYGAGDPPPHLVASLISLLLSRTVSYLTLVDYMELPQSISCEVISYIAHHYRTDITLSDVAREFGLGKYALSRLFSNVLGISFTRYINSLRISYAKHLLHEDDSSILTIAIECGYHNQQTFNRVFKEISGCTPKEFRSSRLEGNLSPIVFTKS